MARPTLVSKQIFIEAPDLPGSVAANTFYTRADGVEKFCELSNSTRSDTTDTIRTAHSADNGRTWGEWQEISFIEETDAGVKRSYPLPGWVDPENGALLRMVLQGTLPTDNPMEGMKNWLLRYQVYTDGGREPSVDKQVIQAGDYTPEHPLEGTWLGKNCFMIGDQTCRPLRTRADEILVPVQVTPVGPDGEYYNPGGGYTYHEAAVLIGRWQDDMTIAWNVSQRVANDPAKSTRGCIEPTLAEMPDGRILMVIRGSNDAKPELPGYKWYSVSDDGGYTWSAPEPWTYTDGEPFYAPSSCTQLIQHSSGRYFWIGNLTPENPQGNLPRDPMVIGEVDPESMMLIRENVVELDSRQPGEGTVYLSNFMVHEDRETQELILHMTRFFPETWEGKPYIYRIQI